MTHRVTRADLQVFRELIEAVATDDPQSFGAAFHDHGFDRDAILRGKAVVVGLALNRSALGYRRLARRLPDESERRDIANNIMAGPFKDMVIANMVEMLVDWACRAASLDRMRNADKDAASVVVVGSYFLIHNSNDWALRYKRFARYALRNISLAEQFSLDGAVWSPEPTVTS